MVDGWCGDVVTTSMVGLGRVRDIARVADRRSDERALEERLGDERLSGWELRCRRCSGRPVRGSPVWRIFSATGWTTLVLAWSMMCVVGWVGRCWWSPG